VKFSYGDILIVLHKKGYCTLRKGDILKNSLKHAVLRKSFELGTIFVVQPNNCTEQTLAIELWNVMRFSDVHLGQQTLENPNHEAISAMEACGESEFQGMNVST
jgi:hypothetical protein